MLRGDKAGLRARLNADMPILHAELYDDVVTHSRSDSRPWRPISPDSDASPYAIKALPDNAAPFSVVQLDSEELAGEAVLWGIDLHNRSAHIGLSLRPGFRGMGLGADVVRILCDYGFTTRGLHRLSIETLSDNQAMIRAALGAGFSPEGTLRRGAWVNGEFLDEALFGLLVDEWRANRTAEGS
jgi:RimJ/RimL family protein N-acetyltransferase